MMDVSISSEQTRHELESISLAVKRPEILDIWSRLVLYPSECIHSSFAASNATYQMRRPDVNRVGPTQR